MYRQCFLIVIVECRLNLVCGCRNMRQFSLWDKNISPTNLKIIFIIFDQIVTKQKRTCTTGYNLDYNICIHMN